MKCFYHPSAEAVCVCVECGRALCPECTESGGEWAVLCGETCLAVRSRRTVLEDASVANLKAQAQGFRACSLLLGLMGTACLAAAIVASVWAFLNYESGWPQLSPSLAEGLGFSSMLFLLAGVCFAGMLPLSRAGKRYELHLERLRVAKTGEASS